MSRFLEGPSPPTRALLPHELVYRGRDGRIIRVRSDEYNDAALEAEADDAFAGAVCPQGLENALACVRTWQDLVLGDGDINPAEASFVADAAVGVPRGALPLPLAPAASPRPTAAPQEGWAALLAAVLDLAANLREEVAAARTHTAVSFHDRERTLSSLSTVARTHAEGAAAAVVSETAEACVRRARTVGVSAAASAPAWAPATGAEHTAVRSLPRLILDDEWALHTHWPEERERADARRALRAAEAAAQRDAEWRVDKSRRSSSTLSSVVRGGEDSLSGGVGDG
jgi:hypothetical protein